jgi:hypothetical protein
MTGNARHLHFSPGADAHEGVGNLAVEIEIVGEASSGFAQLTGMTP